MDESRFTIPSLLSTSRLASLDGLRAISIMMVLLSHFFFETKLNALGLGQIGVEIFFVISGFLITTLLLKEKLLKDKISLKNFYIRRGLRILPVVILYLFVLFFLNFIFHLQISNFSFLTAILFLKNIPFSNGRDWYTAHFWSLAAEEQFYLIFPFFISFLSLKKYKRLVITTIIGLTIVYFCYYGKIGLFYSNRTIHVLSGIIVNVLGSGSILVGSYLSVLMFENSKFINWLSRINNYLLSFIVFLFALIIRVSIFNFHIPFLGKNFLAFLIGFVIILNLNKNAFFAKILNFRFMTEVGVLSYSLYVWQQLFTNHQPWKMIIDSKFLNLLGLLAVAYLSYNLYEKRFLRLKNKFKMIE